MRHEPHIGSECPNCGAILGIEECDWGCFSCGWPDCGEMHEDDEDEEFYDVTEGDDDELPYEQIS